MGSFDVVHSSKGGGSYEESCMLTFRKPPDQTNYEVSSSSAIENYLETENGEFLG